MIRRLGVSLALVAVTLTAYGASKLLEHLPLQWKPTSDLRLSTVEMAQSSVQFESFTDARQKPELIGENREDENKPKPVTTSDDVGAFVSSHMRDLFNKAGLTTVDSNGAVIVKGEIREFFVKETGTYQAQVSVHLTLVDPSGKALWSGTAAGDATRFGRSYRAENYYEVLSDAVVNTTSSVLQSAEVQRALAQH